ncbi:MAG: NYN domain-containing protein [Candidatus Omnitrophota bacterium]
MSRHLLLDGYNVLKQTPEFARQLDRSLEEGRQALMRFIRERRPQGSGRNRLTVIFDGQFAMGGMDPRQALSTDVRVIFTQGASADDHMRQMVEDAKEPGQIICVTNDRELAIICRHRGAVTWSVEDFIARGYKRESLAAARLAQHRHGESDPKVISLASAQRIDKELANHWLRKKG